MEIIALGSNWTLPIMIFAMIKFNQRLAEVQVINIKAYMQVKLYAGHLILKKKGLKTLKSFFHYLESGFRHSVL